MAIQVDYHEYPEDAGSMLDAHRINKRHISHETCGETVKYLEGFLTGSPSDAPGAFTLEGVTVTFQGWDAAANLLRWYY